MAIHSNSEHHFPPSPQSDLFNYLRTEQQEFVKPILRVLKKPAQEELCCALLDYLESGEVIPPADIHHLLYQNRFSTSHPSSLREWFDWLKYNTDFDQLILEHDSKWSYWIHVSCRKNRKANRHQVFYDLKK